MYRVELYARVRRACRVEGMSTREASRVFGLDRKTVRKMLSFSVPPGYRRSVPRRRPKLDAFTGIIDRILEDDRTSHHKQRHTAKRIFDRLRDEYGFTGGYTIVKDYVRERRLRSREMFVPLVHSPGHALRLGAIGFDAVKHLVLCRTERRPPRLDLDVYPYLPRARVAITSAKSYMSLLSGLRA